MIVSLTIVRYRKVLIPFALLSMAIFRLPMRFQKGRNFYRLLGCGKVGNAFSTRPDWQQWAILACWDDRKAFECFYGGSFMAKWWKLFGVEKWTILCQPLQSHGKWGGKEPMINQPIKDYEGPVVVLTRARIRLKSFKAFWESVDPVATRLEQAPGRAFNVPIGQSYRLPGTFSVWDSVANMKAFAYTPGAHVDVMKRAHDEGWFSEDLFARFKPIAAFGTLHHTDPLKGMITFDQL
jgi:hypothetical protein